MRNNNGYTPAELFEKYLERQRILRTRGGHPSFPIHDNFQGFTQDEASCLLLLNGRFNALAYEISRASYGCTCGECLEGFLSPRTLFSLECHAQQAHDKLIRELQHFSSQEWVNKNKDLCFKYIEHKTLRELAREETREEEYNGSSDTRQGVCKVFKHIARCCQAKEIPTTSILLKRMDGANWHVFYSIPLRYYFQNGGTVFALVQAIFELCIEGDKYQGSGEHDHLFAREIAGLKACRNDREFTFARRAYSKLEANSPEVYLPRSTY